MLDFDDRSSSNSSSSKKNGNDRNAFYWRIQTFQTREIKCDDEDDDNNNKIGMKKKTSKRTNVLNIWCRDLISLFQHVDTHTHINLTKWMEMNKKKRNQKRNDVSVFIILKSAKKENHACERAEHAKKRWKKTRKLLTQISWIKSKCYRFSFFFFFIHSFRHWTLLSVQCHVIAIDRGKCVPRTMRTTNSAQRVLVRLRICSTTNCISRKWVSVLTTKKMNFRREEKRKKSTSSHFSYSIQFDQQ